MRLEQLTASEIRKDAHTIFIELNANRKCFTRQGFA